MPRYSFKEGAVITFPNGKKADPQMIGDELDRITLAHKGRLDPVDVVEAARPQRAVLHRYFIWNNQKAADLYRVDQAREIIQSIHVVADEQTADRMTRGFLSIADKQGVAYRQLAEVLTSADLQLALLNQAERDLDVFDRRYRDFQDICQIVAQARDKVRQRKAEMEARPQ